MPTSGRQLVKPPALRPGDTVGVVAPASKIKPSDLHAGCRALERAGYRPFCFDSILDRDLYFAGSTERRARELEEMFKRDDVHAIVCARGGYGANYLLNRLDPDVIKAHPKIFVGYSDITCLLTLLVDNAGLVTFHGPMVAKDWTHPGGVDLSSWQSVLGNASPQEIRLNEDVTALAEGEVEGNLYGGCLSILVASLGTPYSIKPSGTILFLEDIAAKPFQVDRMLTQLKLGGHLDDVRGIIFGQMLDCVQSVDQDYTLQEVIMRIVADLGVPVAFGVKSGHVTSGNITLPLGVPASLSVRQGKVSLKLLEAAVMP